MTESKDNMTSNASIASPGTLTSIATLRDGSIPDRSAPYTNYPIPPIGSPHAGLASLYPGNGPQSSDPTTYCKRLIRPLWAHENQLPLMLTLHRTSKAWDRIKIGKAWMGHRNVKAAEMALERDLNRVVPAVAVSKHDSLLMHKLHVRLHGTQKVLHVHSDGSPYKERAKKVNLDEQRIERWTSRMLSARSTPELHARNVLLCF